tara:strand:- start:1024 stop:1470 length:447 start_codon:yes stop_codon:yes gene_type:complete
MNAKSMKKSDLLFTKVIPNLSQIDTLYELLKQRSDNISHAIIPSFEEHQSFVEDHPYRAWYILSRKDSPIGSVYLTNENSIGINIKDSFDAHELEIILEFIQLNYSPLPQIKSIRRKDFHVNVSPDNHNLLDCLQRLDMKKIQSTYLI